MPYFDDNPLDKLALQPGSADQELDLRGLESVDALARIEQLLDSATRAKTVIIRFDAAANDGRETLFLPIGRRLLAARRNGQLKRCLPLSNGSAYFVETMGRLAD
jgi:hypothetical protein